MRIYLWILDLFHITWLALYTNVCSILLYFAVLQLAGKKQTAGHIIASLIFSVYLVGILTVTGICIRGSFSPTIVCIVYFQSFQPRLCIFHGLTVLCEKLIDEFNYPSICILLYGSQQKTITFCWPELVLHCLRKKLMRWFFSQQSSEEARHFSDREESPDCCEPDAVWRAVAADAGEDRTCSVCHCACADDPDHHSDTDKKREMTQSWDTFWEFICEGGRENMHDRELAMHVFWTGNARSRRFFKDCRTGVALPGLREETRQRISETQLKKRRLPADIQK